jgi:hypothetical protein
MGLAAVERVRLAGVLTEWCERHGLGVPDAGGLSWNYFEDLNAVLGSIVERLPAVSRETDREHNGT